MKIYDFFEKISQKNSKFFFLLKFETIDFSSKIRMLWILLNFFRNRKIVFSFENWSFLQKKFVRVFKKNSILTNHKYAILSQILIISISTKFMMLQLSHNAQNSRKFRVVCDDTSTIHHRFFRTISRYVTSSNRHD